VKHFLCGLAFVTILAILLFGEVNRIILLGLALFTALIYSPDLITWWKKKKR
jgi:hypothetical protein